jgi:protein involved in polysaccharide export with SLBB domain
LAALAAGCASYREGLGNLLRPAAVPDHHPVSVADDYRVSSGDLLEIRVGTWPDLFGPCPVGGDGRIDLGAYRKLWVEGRTLAEIERLVARRTGVPASHVSVRIVRQS